MLSGSGREEAAGWAAKHGVALRLHYRPMRISSRVGLRAAAFERCRKTRLGS